MLHPTTPYRRTLGDGLVLKSVADGRAALRVAEFDGLIHGSGVTDMARELILNHPHTRPEHWLYVQDESTSQIVSSLCLIPWTWRYEDVELQAGEVGIVGTLEAYRLLSEGAAALTEGAADVDTGEGVIEVVRYLAERDVNQEERGEDEVSQQVPLAAADVVRYRQIRKKEPDRQQQE